MKKKLKEQGLEFEFEHVRVARRWDDSSAHRAGVKKLTSTGAADFLLILEAENAPVIFEVTDYRGHHLGTGGAKDALLSGTLVQENIAKVRDTVAGLIWACARNLDSAIEGPIENVAQHIANRHDGAPKLLFVLWMEADKLDPLIASALASKIEGGLRPWLRPKIIVTNRKLESRAQNPLPWVAACNPIP